MTPRLTRYCGRLADLNRLLAALLASATAPAATTRHPAAPLPQRPLPQL